MNSIYDRIKHKRIELNMTQEELAYKLGYKSRSAINKIEKGLRDINQSQVMAFANALQCTPAYLMGWGDDTEGVIDSKDNSQQVTLTAHQKDVIDAYIAQPQMQPAVDRLLGVEPEQE